MINVHTDKFTYEGFLVTKATNGQDGLNKALKEHPDFIIVDNLMPSTDGFYFLEKLRADKWGKKALVVMWSNSHDASTMSRAKKIGILDFMVKSDWEYRDVVKKVNEFLNV